MSIISFFVSLQITSILVDQRTKISLKRIIYTSCVLSIIFFMAVTIFDDNLASSARQ